MQTKHVERLLQIFIPLLHKYLLFSAQNSNAFFYDKNIEENIKKGGNREKKFTKKQIAVLGENFTCWDEINNEINLS